MKKESKHAARLRELGFEHVSRKIVRRVRRSLGHNNRQYVGLQPTFSQNDLITYATDETGQAWFAAGRHDLTSLGFRDNEKWFTETAEGRKVH